MLVDDADTLDDAGGLRAGQAGASTEASASMARLYAWCLRTADEIAAWPRAAAALTLIATISVLAATSRLVLLEFPNSGDEYVYLYQAITMAEGRLTNQAPPRPDAFLFNYIVFDGPRAYGSFPIGWPLLLAAALRLHLPLFLVNPILGGITVVLVGVLGERLYGARVGVLSAVAVGTSSFFLFTGASFFSHTFCGVLLLASACVAARRDPSPPWVPITVGFLVGWAVLARYLTGVIGALPILLFLLRRRGQVPATVVLVGLGGLPWVLVLAAYNQAMNGTPWKLTTLPATVNLWFREGFLRRAPVVLATHVYRLLLWAPAVFVIAYVWALRRFSSDRERGLIGATLAVIAAIHYFYLERGGNQYGPRFYYEGFLLAVPFVIGQLFTRDRFEELSRGGRRIFAGLVFSLAIAPLAYAGHAWREGSVIRERTDVYDLVDRADLRHALVFVDESVGTGRRMSALDLTRNGVRYDGTVLYARDLGPIENCGTARVFPTRQPWLYEWDVMARRGLLLPLRCAP